MILRKLVFSFSFLVCLNISGMVTPRATGGSGEPSSQPTTPERDNRTRVKPDTGGNSSVPPSPERGDGNVADGLNLLQARLLDDDDDEFDFDNFAIQLNGLQRAARQLFPQYYNPSIWVRCKKTTFDLATKGSVPTNYFMAYMVTEVLCELKKSWKYRTEGDVCKATVLQCDFSAVTRCAQRIVAGVCLAFLKGFFATVAAKNGIKTLLCTHFLMQSAEALCDYLGISEHFDYDLECYVMRLILPSVLILFKEFLMMSEQEVTYLLGSVRR
jgi:hypothetical protein